MTRARRSPARAALPPGRVRTRRWNDPIDPGDGLRLLVCRYRPRALRKSAETWDAWDRELGPSTDLHADFYGKRGPPISWAEYRARYLREIAERPAAAAAIAALAGRVRAGETITLLCSSACTDEERCHRALLRDRILAAAVAPRAPRAPSAPARRRS